MEQQRSIFGNSSRKNGFDYLEDISAVPVTPQASIRRPSDRRYAPKTVSFIQKEEKNYNEDVEKPMENSHNASNNTIMTASNYNSAFMSPISNPSQSTYRSRVIDQSSVMKEISEPSPLKFTSEYGKSSYMGPISEGQNDDSYFSQKSFSEQTDDLPSVSLFSSSAHNSRIRDSSSDNSDALLEEEDYDTETEIKSELDILREENERLRKENELLKKDQPATNEQLKKVIKRLGDAILPMSNRRNISIDSICSDAEVLDQYVNDIIDAHNLAKNESQKSSAVTQLATTVIETISQYEQNLNEQHQELLSLYNPKPAKKSFSRYLGIYN